MSCGVLEIRKSPGTATDRGDWELPDNMRRGLARRLRADRRGPREAPPREAPAAVEHGQGGVLRLLQASGLPPVRLGTPQARQARPQRRAALHGSAPSLPSLRPSESGTRVPRRARRRAPRGPSGTRRARRRRTPRPPLSGPRGHPRAACGWGRGTCGELRSTAPGHTRGAAAPRRSRGAHGPEGGVVSARRPPMWPESSMELRLA